MEYIGNKSQNILFLLVQCPEGDYSVAKSYLSQYHWLPFGALAYLLKEEAMPKRPGRERGVEYDRTGRPITGVTTTKSIPAIAGIDDEDDSDE